MLIEKFAKVHESFEPTWAYFETNTKHDFVLKPGGTQKFLLFGVHLDLKPEAEIKGWNPKVIQLKKIFLVWPMRNHRFFFFFRWSNQGMYAIRVGIICYDRTRFGRVLWRKAQWGNRSSWYMSYPLRVSIHISEGHMSPCYLLDIIKTDRSLKVQNSVLPASERTDKLSLVVEKQKE